MWQFKSLKAINIISFKNVEFNFRNGKAILVTGSNLDDHNQKVNGSGKSSLIESIAIAISGNSIRDVKVKELIYNGCPDGNVELKLFNSQLDKELVIWRKIYANTKSAEARAWINGEDQCKLYSDINGFNAWIWKTLGISKEDFFSFYLITSDAYEPFLSVGDVKKKEIINRFSGADKVDTVFPEIEKDSKESGLNILQQERLLLANTTKQELLTSQLEEAKEEVSEEKMNDLIETKIFTIRSLEQNKITLTEELETINFQIQSIDSDIYAFNQNSESELKLYEANISEAKKNLVKFQSESNAALQPFKDELEIAELEVEIFEFTKDYDAELKKIDSKRELINESIKLKKLEILNLKNKINGEVEKMKTLDFSFLLKSDQNNKLKSIINKIDIYI